MTFTSWLLGLLMDMGIAWLVFGALVGWIAAIVTRTKQGVLSNIAVGILGSFLGGFLFSFLVRTSPADSFNLTSLLFALVGSVVLLLITMPLRRSLSHNRVLGNKTPVTISSPSSQKQETSTPSNTAVKLSVYGNPSISTIDTSVLPANISFMSDTNIKSSTLIIGTEEVPLDNRFGSSVLVSEHEFTRKASRTIKIGRHKDLEMRLQAGIWSFLESEARISLAQSIGIDLQSEEFRRVTLRFEAAPGKLVLYRVVWKQSQRVGEAEMQVGGKMIKLPYVATYGLSHSVESVLQQS
jgi:uncharacterized membrane protein YeaQ/YmgE (transglycosylase-associated protein family)